MMKKTSENTADDSGFFVPGKGVNHMMVSLIIWATTGFIYKVSTLFFNCVKYELVCFISSFALSLISGIIINRKLLKKHDFGKKFIYGFANILLLYTSSNGMQAAYCVTSKPGANETSNCASLIPFIEARPWLPALYHISILEDLSRENDRFKADLKDTTGMTEKGELIDEISILKSVNRALQHEIDKLQPTQDNNPQQAQLSSDCNLLYDQIDTLQQRIQKFNQRQSDWKRLADIKHINTVNNIVTSATHDSGFYNFLFNTPIDASLFMSRPE